MDLLQHSPHGLYCEAGDFYIDPWHPVDRALITHAHGDHARAGSKSYLAAAPGEDILRHRMGPDSVVQSIAYGEKIRIKNVDVSFHPAGHLLGSAQIRVSDGKEVWVASGDYKTLPDPTCAPFEPVKCDTFLTECTFGLPIYKWPDPDSVIRDINAWWAGAKAQGRTCLLFAYALGKAQHILSGLDASIGPILLHGAVDSLVALYRRAGVQLPPTQPATLETAKATRGQALVIAPPSAQATPWMRKFGAVSTGFASGWMLVRGARRWRSLDRGFVLSDHADWSGLLGAIQSTSASRIGVMHGKTGPLTRYLKEQGRDAFSVSGGHDHDHEEARDEEETG